MLYIIELGNNTSAYNAVWFRLTMLQIYLYHYWTAWQKRKRKEDRLVDYVRTVYMGRPNYYIISK